MGGEGRKDEMIVKGAAGAGGSAVLRQDSQYPSQAEGELSVVQVTGNLSLVEDGGGEVELLMALVQSQPVSQLRGNLTSGSRRPLDHWVMGAWRALPAEREIHVIDWCRQNAEPQSISTRCKTPFKLFIRAPPAAAATLDGLLF